MTELISFSRDGGTDTTGALPRVAVTSRVEFSRPSRRKSFVCDR